MTDGQTLFLILVLVYLSDCLIWVKRESVAFVSNWRGRWRLTVPPSWLGNAKGGILFLSPAPPAGRIFLSHLSPISISPSGICAYNLQTLPSEARSPSQTGHYLSFDRITTAATDGVYLIVNEAKFAKCATPRQAKVLVQLIRELIKTSASKRERVVRAWVQKQFAIDDAVARLAAGKAIIEPVQELSMMLFLFLFVVTPALASGFGLMPLIFPVAAVMVVLAVLIGVMFYRAHKQLFPSEGAERFENLLKMILCPPVSIRAADVLSRNLLADYSPIVLATVLGGSSEQQFVRAFVLDLQHPLKHEVSDETAAKTMRWAVEEQLGQVQQGHFLKSEDLLPPSVREKDSISYCPRCRCQYVVTAAECPDCPGVELVAFALEGPEAAPGA
jgi:hypothetical protein